MPDEVIKQALQVVENPVLEGFNGRTHSVADEPKVIGEQLGQQGGPQTATLRGTGPTLETTVSRGG